MNRLEILYSEIDKQDSVKLSKLNWWQLGDYYLLNERIDRLFALQFFLNLRRNIKKTVEEKYIYLSQQQIAESIVEYDEYGFVEYENKDIFNLHLNPMIENYVNRCFAEISKHNLKLELWTQQK